jgi:P4 family phage/plasmid primase-like protien
MENMQVTDKKLKYYQVGENEKNYNVQPINRSFKKYFVPKDKVEKFAKICEFMAGDKFHLAFHQTEKADYTQFRFDIDLCIEGNEEDKPSQLFYSIDQVRSATIIIEDVLRKNVEGIEDKNLECALLEKPMYFDGVKKRWKNGFHLQYPYLYLINSEAAEMVKSINSRLSSVFKKYFKEDPGFYTGAWLIYGANKENEIGRYALTSIFDRNFKRMEIALDIPFLVKLFWLFKTERTEKYCLSMKVAEFSDLEDPSQDEEEEDEEDDEEKNGEWIEMKLSGLSKRRVESTQCWKAVVCAVVSYGKREGIEEDTVKNILESWSRTSEIGNFTDEGFLRVIEYAYSEKNKIKADTFLKIWRADNRKFSLFKSMTDRSIAELTNNIFRGKIFMKNDREGWIYDSEGLVWKAVEYYEIYDFAINDLLKVGRETISEVRKENKFNEKSKMKKGAKTETDPKYREKHSSPISVDAILVDEDKIGIDLKYRERMRNYMIDHEEKKAELEARKRDELDELKQRLNDAIQNTSEIEGKNSEKEKMKNKAREKYGKELLKIDSDHSKNLVTLERGLEKWMEREEKEEKREKEREEKEEKREKEKEERQREKEERQREKEEKQREKEPKNIIDALNRFIVYLSSVTFKTRLSKALVGFCLNSEFGDILDKPNNFLPIRGGKKINLETGDISTRGQDDYFTFETGIGIEEDREKLERANKFFLDLGNGDLSAATDLKKLLIYCLSGEVFDRSFYQLTGSGRNGKTTYINIISHILKRLSGAGSKMLVIKDQKHGNRYDGPNPFLLSLKGKRTVFISETDHTDLLNCSHIKNLTGGDFISARNLYCKDVVEFQNRAKIVIASNFPLQFHGTDRAIKDRIKYFKFENTFEVDPLLDEKIRENKDGFIDSIFTVCLEDGKESLRLKKIDWGKKTLDDTRGLFGEMDSVAPFIEEVCIEDKEGFCSSSELYELYKSYCINNDIDRLTDKGFSKSMQEKGFEKRKCGKNPYRNRNCYFGVRLEKGMSYDL